MNYETVPRDLKTSVPSKWFLGLEYFQTKHLSVKRHKDIEKFYPYSFRGVFRNSFQFLKLLPKFFIVAYTKAPLEQAIHSFHPYVKARSGKM